MSHQKRKSNDNNPFVMLYKDILQSDAWKRLNNPARVAYLHMGDDYKVVEAWTPEGASEIYTDEYDKDCVLLSGDDIEVIVEAPDGTKTTYCVAGQVEVFYYATVKEG